MGEGFVFDTGGAGVVGNSVEIMWGNLIREEGDVGHARGLGQGYRQLASSVSPLRPFMARFY